MQSSLDEQNTSFSKQIYSSKNILAITEHDNSILQDAVKSKDSLIEQLNSKSIHLLDQQNSQTNMIINLNNTIRNIEKDYAMLEDKYAELQKQVERNIIEINQLRSENRILLTRLQSCTNEKTTPVPDINKYPATEGKCPPFGNFSGDHLIRVSGIPHPFRIPCNSDNNKKDWTVIQRRLDHKLDFNRNWESYREGFGDYKSEFFAGLKLIHLMTTSQPHELLIRLRTREAVKFARYSHFEIADEDEDFRLKSLGNYTGDADDGMRESEGIKFSTLDRDNDLLENSNCAAESQGAWWLTDCGVT